METRNTKKIVIVGGGFSGIRTALDLNKKKLKDTRIILISNRTHFEYYPSLYRVVAGANPLEVCIPLSDIFSKTRVEVVHDNIINFDIKNKILIGESTSEYSYDYLVLGLGSETVYFNIPGIKENSFGLKSINDALRLKNHLHDIFKNHSENEASVLEANKKIVIIGGGATGTELSGELAKYMIGVMKTHKINDKDFGIFLIESSPRVLSSLPFTVSNSALHRLQNLGVHVIVGKPVLKQEGNQVFVGDMVITSNTIIWTAGVKPSHIYKEINGLTVNEKGKVIVNEYMEDANNHNVFVIGDGAQTMYSGFAQTAIHDGEFVASVINSRILGLIPKKYKIIEVSSSIPVGKPFALLYSYGFFVSGFLGWVVRRLIDFHFLLTILPFNKAVIAFLDGEKLTESCLTCSSELEK